MTYLKVFALMFGILSMAPAQAQQTEAVPQEVVLKKTETIQLTVSGVCGMCRDRIENAALIKGVKLAEYDLQKQTLTVVYKTSKTTAQAIHEAVAAAGHDTDKVKAQNADYSKLPGCCAYRDGVEIH